MTIYSFSQFGFEGSIISVEVDLRRGIPATDIVGLADSSVKELRERMKAAIINQGFEYPSERVLICLSPADIKKEVGGFDLPTALAVLTQKDGTVSNDESVLVMGELDLSGAVRSVKGICAALQSAKNQGIKYAIIPSDSISLSDIPSGMKVAEVKSLSEAYSKLSLEGFYEKNSDDKSFKIEFENDEGAENLDSIEGMNELKFAMAVAVAGHHNILAYGKPGCGKSLTLGRMKELLPKLLPDEQESVKRIYSLCGLNRSSDNKRPFRMPHQTATIEGICGGGIRCNPGEISLAHNGILFLDEAAEFRSSVLQILRVPLECHSITLSRAGRSTVFPANFQLVMATNSCPCGNYGSDDMVCLCSARSVEQYWRKFSSPLIDRMEIRVNCNKKDTCAEYSRTELREMIERAWKAQYERQGKLNGELTNDDFDKNIKLDEYAKQHLDRKKGRLSERELKNVMKVARTLMDMTTGGDVIDDTALSRALQLHAKTPLELM